MLGDKSTLFIAMVIGSLSLCWVTATKAAEKPTCMYISSYHQGYAWSDGIEAGLRENISQHCVLIRHDMDTKRRKTTEQKLAAGAIAFELIKKINPDIVITSDDNVAKYLVVPYLKDKSIPVIFTGVNWTVKEYGFPFSNTTGIIEVSPLKSMLKQAQQIAEKSTRVVFLSADVLSSKKNYLRLKKTAAMLDITLEANLVTEFSAWKEGFKKAQEYDFVILGSKSGIKNWNVTEAESTALHFTEKLTLTNQQWMMPYSIMGYTKIAEEQGEWAAKAAIAVLSGSDITQIPIVTNRKWDIWLNTEILSQTNLQIDQRLQRKAKKIRQHAAEK